MERTCKICGETKPLEKFTNNGTRKDGTLYRKHICMCCERESKRLVYHGLPKLEAKKEKSQESIKKDLILAKKQVGCSQCGYNEYNFCIDLHHVNPNDKDSRLRKHGTFQCLPLEDLILELDKCTPLCAMCHRKVHAGIIKLK